MNPITTKIQRGAKNEHHIKYGPSLWIGFNCLIVAELFNHKLHKSPWYSFEEPWVGKSPSQPSSHLLIGEFPINNNIYPETYTKNLEAVIEKQKGKKI